MNYSQSFDHEYRDVLNTVVASDALNYRFPFVDLAVLLASNRLAFGIAQVHAYDIGQPFDMLKV